MKSRLSLNKVYILLPAALFLFLSILYVCFSFFNYLNISGNSPIKARDSDLSSNLFEQKVLINTPVFFSTLPPPSTTTTLGNQTVKKEEDVIYNEEDLRFENINIFEKKFKKLLIDTNVNSSIDTVCNSGTNLQKEMCRQDLFIGCGDSFYLSTEMAPECNNFEIGDLQKYVLAKKSQTDNSFLEKDSVETKLGIIKLSEKSFTSQTSLENKGLLNSGAINTSRSILSKLEQENERLFVEPEINALSNRDTNSSLAFKSLNYSGWVVGWGTLFAINGGKSESGFKMFSRTAFGLNPYRSDACLVSLPYKTVDKFFGTTLDYCVKTRNSKCVIEIKESIKNRKIEVFMFKNGKNGVFKLGDLGPAEWTGNAIDFTACTAKVLGATGKDQVKFRVYAKI